MAALLPGIVVAGLSGDAGKTVVSLAILRELRQRGVRVRAFKKGPDYIDAAWLAWASGTAARNLDTYLMGGDVARRSFLKNATGEGLNLVEGNRGLFDGLDAGGTHSTAELAKLLGAPVLLVVSAEKVTRTAAAVVLGCQRMDPALRLAAVVLNRVSSQRHESVLRAAIEETCGVPVIGCIPRLAAAGPVPMRHLGLVTPEEHGAEPRDDDELTASLLAVAGHIDLDQVLAIAGSAGSVPGEAEEVAATVLPDGRCLTIGVVRDSAFNFYYAENLEQLERSGARVVAVSALTAAALPAELDALYIGGGFPETHAARLAANTAFLGALRAAAAAGLPIYAECGGLMLLSQFIRWQGATHPMAGVLPFGVEMSVQPQGHGYSEVEVDGANSFFAAGTRLRGHEFHYSKIVGALPPTACAVQRGTGCGGGRDAVVVNRVWASYTHLHALATPEFVEGMIRAARERQGR